MRAAGANPGNTDLEKIIGNKSHLTLEQVTAAMSGISVHEDPKAVVSDCLAIFDRYAIHLYVL